MTFTSQPSDDSHDSAAASKGDGAVSPAADDRLAPLRQRIDEIDQKLVELLNERAGIVVEVGEIKRDTASPIYAPEREREVLQRVRSHNRGPLPNACLDAIWREMMSGSFALEQPLRIGYLGPPGSFSHLAATRQFGASVEYDNLADIGAIFDAVARRDNDYGLVPIENSSEGSVSATLDGLLETQVQIVAEVLLPVHHNLLANCNAPSIRQIYSHPQALGQCRRWLAMQFPRVEQVASASTSQAAEIAARHADEGAAAIGSTLAGKIHDVHVQFENIEDNPSNCTRFFIIGHQRPAPTGDDKTSILFTTRHKAGALAEVLDVLRDAGLNLTHIDKRPNQRANWEYSFFIDMVGHRDDPAVTQAIEAASEHCLHLTVLGSFPRAKDTL